MTTADSTFAGSMPEFYDRCLVPMHFAPYTEIVAARLLTEATDAVAAALEDRFGGGEIAAPARTVLVSTRRPRE